MCSVFLGFYCLVALYPRNVAPEITVKLPLWVVPPVAPWPFAPSLLWLQVPYFCPMCLEQNTQKVTSTFHFPPPPPAYGLNPGNGLGRFPGIPHRAQHPSPHQGPGSREQSGKYLSGPHNEVRDPPVLSHAKHTLGCGVTALTGSQCLRVFSLSPSDGFSPHGSHKDVEAQLHIFQAGV